MKPSYECGSESEFCSDVLDGKARNFPKNGIAFKLPPVPPCPHSAHVTERDTLHRIRALEKFGIPAAK
jgi:hypothetical protein